MTVQRSVKIEKVSSLVTPGINKKKTMYAIRTPFLCPICDEVWQPRTGPKGKDKLDDFPRIGCSLNMCPRCNKHPIEAEVVSLNTKN